MIPCPANALIKALLFEYQYNVGHLSYRRLIVSFLKRYGWDNMILDYELYCQHCVICNTTKPSRRGGASLQLLGIPEYPWQIVGINYVTDLPKMGLYGHTIFFIMVCILTNMAHFVPCHKKIIAEVSVDLFVSCCYRLHGVPKEIVSDRDRKFVVKFWQRVMGKLNTKLYMSAAPHPRIDGLMERVNQIM